MPQKISLLVPCYNAENYINSFILHLIEVNLQFDEVIFYNDGSNDNTLEILKKSGYKYIHATANRGPGYARNRLAEAASYEYIHFHDVDDKFSPDFIDIVNGYLPGKPDVIVGNADWIDEQNGTTMIEWRYNAGEAKANTLAYFIAHPLGIINTVYKKEAFLATGGFDENIHCWEDSDLHIKMANSSCKFAFTENVLAYSIRHNNGISKNQDFCWQCRLKFLQKYLVEYPADYIYIILEQVERCTQAFYNAGMISDFDKSVGICKQYGLHLPVSKQPMVNVLKKIHFPPRLIYDMISRYNKFKKHISV